MDVSISVSENANLEKPDREKIIKLKTNTKSANEFFNILYEVAPEMSRCCKKSKYWGEALMKYAFENEKDRPHSKAIMYVLRATDIKYQISRDKFKVDPTTGNLIERQA